MQADINYQKVKEYYGKVLTSKSDLKTTACCSDALPKELREIEQQIHPDILQKFYGCGSPFPPLLEGRTVLDLGCGTGRDVYILSKLVGEKGKVIGVDMTSEQIDVAKKYQDYHAKQFNYKQSNVEFHQGYIEDLSFLADNSVDLVVSNCVINLSPCKEAVFAEIFRVLKKGGELYFSDVYADRRLPKELMEDGVLLGECLGGALYEGDLRRIMLKLNINDIRTVTKVPIKIENDEIIAKVGAANFYSICTRAFKIDLEDRCEDYGQIAFYKGGIPECPNYFMLDDHHLIEKNRPFLVCANSAAMLAETYYGSFFEIQGNTEVHLGIFGGCGPVPASATDSSAGCC